MRKKGKCENPAQKKTQKMDVCNSIPIPSFFHSFFIRSILSTLFWGGEIQGVTQGPAQGGGGSSSEAEKIGLAEKCCPPSRPMSHPMGGLVV